MELLYNPDAISEAEIKATFVARQRLVDELVSLVERQPQGAGMQHAVIIAPRGMGKTTVLLMVKFGIRDRGLGERWQAVKFPEESYGVYDLADFWIEVLNLLASETNDVELGQRAESLKTQYPNSDDLQQAALAVIKDWRREHGKRLVLLVENFDLILDQINDERDNAGLREVLMNDGTLMLLGGATTFFKEARAYDQPLYNFFKVYDLSDLNSQQIQELLCRRAELDRIPDFEQTLQANASRLRALEYFTGGNPRLVLMLYRVVTQSDITEVRRGLEKLLDEVTPYYKAKVESLPAQQRKILDHIARVSAKTSEGLPPGAIATAVRLSPNQVSAQLKRLSEIGYVRSANLRGRSAYYTLCEPLYALWHQMRFGREARQRMQWLVQFLSMWYAGDELGWESERLTARFREHLSAGRSLEAHDVLEHHRYLAEAMENAPARASAMERVIRGYLDLSDTGTVKNELLATVKLENLSEETLHKLQEAGCLTEEQVIRARTTKPSPAATAHEKEFAEAMASATLAHSAGRFESARQYLDQALKLKPDNDAAWTNRGNTLDELGRFEEAIASCDHVLKLKPDYYAAWYARGYALAELSRFEEAIASFDRALKLKPDDDAAWANRGVVYLQKFVQGARAGALERATQDWNEALRCGRKAQVQDWPNILSAALLQVARSGQLSFVRQLIADSDLEQRLFPLARAIDYLLTGHEALIEKLSPEVRGIVDEVVATLRPVVGVKSQRTG
ncbi:MAG: tetratricopeptide repeat protein [Gammaproteobacteria bacterium]